MTGAASRPAAVESPAVTIVTSAACVGVGVDVGVTNVVAWSGTTKT